MAEQRPASGTSSMAEQAQLPEIVHEQRRLLCRLSSSMAAGSRKLFVWWMLVSMVNCSRAEYKMNVNAESPIEDTIDRLSMRRMCPLGEIILSMIRVGSVTCRDSPMRKCYI